MKRFGLTSGEQKILRDLTDAYVKVCGGKPNSHPTSRSGVAYQKLYSGISEIVLSACRDTREEILSNIYRALQIAASGDE